MNKHSFTIFVVALLTTICIFLVQSTMAQLGVTNKPTSITPQSLLHVHDDHPSGQIFKLTNTTSGYTLPTYGFCIQLDPSFKVNFKNQYNNASAGISFFTNDGAITERLTITNNGRIGIGTTSPSYLTDILGNTGDLNSARILNVENTSTSTTAQKVMGIFAKINSPLTSSNPGIGVFGYSANSAGSGMGIRGESAGMTGYWIFGWATHSSGINYGIYGWTNSSSGYAGYFVGGKNYFEGKVGIGNTDPDAKLHVATTGSVKTGYFTGNGTGLSSVTLKSENTSTGSGVAAYLVNSGTDATLVLGQVTGATGPLLKGFGSNGGNEEIRIENDGTTDFYNSSYVKTIEIDPSESGTADAGQITLYNSTGTAVIELDGNYGSSNKGRITVSEVEITGGSELAEPFDILSSEQIEAGMVLSIDEQNPGKLKICDKEYDACVAGIVSGASNISPGLIMRQKGTETDGKHLVALTGRVYCLVDATVVPVKPGDLLTSSSTPGYAMKALNHKKSQGAIIGKAMT